MRRRRLIFAGGIPSQGIEVGSFMIAFDLTK
jgi:hypothetical protein